MLIVYLISVFGVAGLWYWYSQYPKKGYTFPTLRDKFFLTGLGLSITFIPVVNTMFLVAVAVTFARMYFS